MNNRVIIGIFVFLAILSISLGAYSYTLHQQIDTLSGELGFIQREQAALTSRVTDEFTTFRAEAQSGKARTATKVVAASNASADSKLVADFVCDGTTDQVEIQAAIDALSATGGDIHLSEGTFTVNIGGINLNKLNTRISGARSTIIKLADAQATGNVIGIRANGCSIEGITIDGDFAGQVLGWGSYVGIQILNNATDVVVRDCEIKNVGSDAIITAGNNHRTRVYDNLVHDCGEGILLQTSDYCEARGNNLYNIGTGSSTTQDGIEPSGSSYCVIADNVLYNIDGSGIDNYNGSHYNSITGNVIIQYGQDDSGIPGIELISSDYCSVIGNTVKTGPGAGILVNDSTGTSVSGNTIYECSNGATGNGFGVEVEVNSAGTTISGNTFTYCGAAAVRVLSGDCTIIGNTSSTCARPYDVRGNYNVVVGNKSFSQYIGETAFLIGDNYNIVTDNYMDGNARDSYGIRSLGDYDLIANNTIRNFTDPAKVVVISGANTICRQNIGYVTENSGPSTITAGQTSVNVTHGLATTPTRVILIPTAETAGRQYWVSAKGAATFTITIDSAHTADITFDWRAVIREGN